MDTATKWAAGRSLWSTDLTAAGARAHAEISRSVPGPPQPGVLSPGLDQFVVRPQLGDPAVRHDRDAVGVVGGVQAVRDGDHRTAGEDGAHRALGVARGGRVE